MTHTIETPVPISTTFDKYCDNCNLCTLVLNNDELYFDGVHMTVYNLTCAHLDKCRHLAHNLKYIQMLGEKDE